MTITLEQAIELYQQKQTEEANKLIKTFDGREDVQLLNGKYGPYLKIGKDNFKLPKDSQAELLTLDECLKLAEEQGTKPKGKKIVRKK